MSQPRAFYRSTLFRRTLVLAGLVSALTCWFAPKQWLNTPGLRLVHSYGLPWWVWGIGFAAFAAMLCSPSVKWHVRADWWGLFLYTIVFASVCLAIRPDRPTNLIICSLALIGLVSLYQAAKLATFDREGL